MNIEITQFIKKAFDHTGNADCDIRENYSGRGMYGRTTPAIIVDNPGEVLPTCLGYVKDRLEEIVDNNRDEAAGSALKRYVEALPDFSEMASLRTDSMGMKTVLY